MGLLLPVGQRRMSSWEAHQHRNPRSSEPGTDFYCPIGTPVYAPEDGRVYNYGTSIVPPTGRWVGLDLDNGMRFRTMHLSRIVLSDSVLRNNGFVRKGQLIAYSGASGYGQENWENDPYTGGAHTHVTLWPTHETKFGYKSNGKPYTIDFMNYADPPGSGAGGGTNPIESILEDAMSNPIVNVVAKYGDAKDTGTLWFGVSDGSFERYVAPYDPNVRGVASAVFYGSETDKIPTVNQRDFQTVQRIWKTMQSRR